MVIPLQSPGMGLQSGRADLDAATAHPPWTRWLCEPARAPSGLCGSFVTLSLVTWRFPTVHWYGCNRGSRHNKGQQTQVPWPFAWSGAFVPWSEAFRVGTAGSESLSQARKLEDFFPTATSHSLSLHQSRHPLKGDPGTGMAQGGSHSWLPEALEGNLPVLPRPHCVSQESVRWGQRLQGERAALVQCPLLLPHLFQADGSQGPLVPGRVGLPGPPKNCAIV